MLTNCGEAAGQVVGHLHFHILAERNLFPNGAPEAVQGVYFLLTEYIERDITKRYFIYPSIPAIMRRMARGEGKQLAVIKVGKMRHLTARSAALKTMQEQAFWLSVRKRSTMKSPV